ncbi:MAG: DUF4105 domain-containing protein [Kiritimatiellae bacterium]|nr:DUF4105 domain-containing protein [Kiritimatiellia bacterium]
MRRIAVLLFACTLAAATFAAEGAALPDGVDRNSPDFVKASLVVMSPGNEIFSCAGHVCLRLECPTFKLDNCFSYESEEVQSRVLAFLAGKLKMGMFCVPTDKFLNLYRDEGREVRQYRLDLPPVVKQRLWKVMDDKVAEGIALPYDYVHRGCAWSVLGCLREATKPVEIVAAPSPEKLKKSRREILAGAVADYPWFRFAHQALIGADVDFGERPADKVILPTDLVAFLQGACLAGRPILSSEHEILLPKAVAIEPASWCSPFAAAFLLLALAGVNFFLKSSCLDWAFLLLQTAAGAFFVYLVVFSDLPATNWNWLLVPFNPLPFLLWKWRRRWALVFAAVLLVWVMGMEIQAHQLTDPAFLIIGLAYVVFYSKIAFANRWQTIPAGALSTGFSELTGFSESGGER